MAFDAFVAAAVTREIKAAAVGAKVEKIYQPTKDEAVLSLRAAGKTLKLFISANPASARVCLTTLERDNPKTPPMFCMLLRKHLTGAVVDDVYMYGFERIIEISFSAYSELGTPCKKYLTAEIMGKCSNLFLLGDDGGEKKILGLVHPADLATATRRRVIPGVKYELPPPQQKDDPREETEAGFLKKLSAYPPERGADKFIIDTYLGFSPLLARECAFRAGGLKNVSECSPRLMWRAFSDVVSALDGDVSPSVAVRDGKTVEYSFVAPRQYENAAEIKTFGTFAEMFDFYYGERERAEAMRARAHDIEAILSSARKKLERKLPVLQEELAACAEAEKMKLWGDLITASIYKLDKKAESCEVVNYYSENLENVTIPLDIKLTPSQNAARYYKKYNKYKTAREVLSKQIEKTLADLSYLDTVEGALRLCENEAEISEIRLELAESGYSPKTAMTAKARARARFSPKHFITSGGYECIVGKNNLQNDYVTTKLSKKSDWWFHVKNGAGSHVLLICDADDEPGAADFTEAAQLAAYFSSFSGGENVPVDYTKVKNVKKPAGSVPGYVIYTSNFTAYVDPKCECKEI